MKSVLSKSDAKSIKNLLETYKLLGFLSENERDGHVAINVKLDGMRAVTYDSVFTDEFMKDNKLTKGMVNLIKRAVPFDEIYNDWLCVTTHFYINQYLLDGCAFQLPLYYTDRIDLIKNGFSCGIASIDKLETTEAKVAALLEQNKYDSKMIDAISFLSSDKVQQFGRSGGWLAIDDFEDYENSKLRLSEFFNTFTFSENVDSVTYENESIDFDNELDSILEDVVSLERVSAMLLIIGDIEERVKELKTGESLLDFVIDTLDYEINSLEIE